MPLMCKVLLRLGSKLAASWAAATTPLSLPTALVGHTNDPPAASACKDMVPTAPAAKQSKREGRGRRAGQGRAGQGRAGQGRAGQGRSGQGRAGRGGAGPYRDAQDKLLWRDKTCLART